MSGIYRRTAFASVNKSGVHTYHDWATVVTGVGSCMEPHIVNARSTQTAYDDDDMMSRVDDVHLIDPGRHLAILSDGDDIRLHGGLQSLTG